MDGSSNPADTNNDQTNRLPQTVPSTSMTMHTREEHGTTNVRPFTMVPNSIPFLTGPLPPVAPEAYNYLIHALLALQRSATQQHPQAHSGNYHQPMSSGQCAQGVPPNYGLMLPPGVLPMSNMNGTSAGFPPMHQSNTNPSFQGLVPPAMTTPPQSAVQPVVFPNQTDESPEQVEEEISIAEDKRRRNTAASARFRIKKKLKVLNLERTVADLAGRTEELEREAADLRRENGWLKEIILLKSRNIGGFGSTGPQPIESTGLQEPPGNNGGGSSSAEGSSRKKGKSKEVG
ncbi:hypothetical protein ID866_819 [Astraeus odoratus]|nr:hypothetical protein ID866_819 [Astraeus odoratus]